jgi:hypothetical protein
VKPAIFSGRQFWPNGTHRQRPKVLAMYTTIRKNSLKKIGKLLRAAVLITGYKYDDMGSTADRATAADVLALAEDFRSVYLDSLGVLHVCITQNHTYKAFPSEEAARKSLTPEAVVKYFGADAKTSSTPASKSQPDELVTADITDLRIARVARDWTAIAGEPVFVEVFQNTFLARLTELGALRLEHKYASPKARAVKERMGDSWTFRLETTLGVKPDVEAARGVN